MGFPSGHLQHYGVDFIPEQTRRFSNIRILVKACQEPFSEGGQGDIYLVEK
jgi:hypothetical protein